MRLLVVEDDASIAEPLRTGLRREGFEVEQVGTGAAALAAGDCDLVLLDLGLPDLDGRVVCRELRARSGVPIIVVTARSEEIDRVSLLELGADDYVVKPFDLLELDMRVQAVLRRVQPSRVTDVLRVGKLGLDSHSREASSGAKKAVLTSTEFTLLEYMMRRPGEMLTTHRLLEEVWDYPPGVGDPALVRMHIRNLREKLEEDPSQPRWIVTMGRQGYLIPRE